jgi:cellulose biosynthesis protein BcsQ
MMVADVAWMLATNGFRVAVIDWDLEAPGIHRYFHPFLQDKDLGDTLGLLDMVETLAASAATSPEPPSPDIVDIVDYIEPLEWPRDTLPGLSWRSGCFKSRGRIDLLPAGRQGPAYSRRLSTFNWVDFYERLGGRSLLKAARDQLQSIYDFVLIDSRTGVSDTSGICTVEMPDTVVVCFTLNNQSIRGAAAVAESIRDERKARSLDSPFRIFPIPTRVEITSEHQKRQAALELARQTFAFLMPEIKTDDEAKYWGSVQMPYFPFYAFEEIPAAFGDRPDETLSLSNAITSVTKLIVGSDVQIRGFGHLAQTEQEAEVARREVMRWYLRPVATTKQNPVETFEHVYNGLNRRQQSDMKRLLLRMVVVGNTTMPSARIVDSEELDEWPTPVAQLLTDARLLRVTESGARRTVELTEPSLVQGSKSLQSWVNSDRPFLVWRLGLDAAADNWRNSTKEESLLLRGSALQFAVRTLKERREDLNHGEQEYIQASLRASESQVTAGSSVLELSKQPLRNRLVLAGFMLFALVVIAIVFVYVYSSLIERSKYRDMIYSLKQQQEELRTRELALKKQAAELQALRREKLQSNPVQRIPAPAAR